MEIHLYHSDDWPSYDMQSKKILQLFRDNVTAIPDGGYTFTLKNNVNWRCLSQISILSRLLSWINHGFSPSSKSNCGEVKWGTSRDLHYVTYVVPYSTPGIDAQTCRIGNEMFTGTAEGTKWEHKIEETSHTVQSRNLIQRIAKGCVRKVMV